MPTKSTFEDLPKQILVKIFKHLSEYDRKCASEVCKTFYKAWLDVNFNKDHALDLSFAVLDANKPPLCFLAKSSRKFYAVRFLENYFGVDWKSGLKKIGNHVEEVTITSSRGLDQARQVELVKCFPNIKRLILRDELRHLKPDIPLLEFHMPPPIFIGRIKYRNEVIGILQQLRHLTLFGIELDKSSFEHLMLLTPRLEELHMFKLYSVDHEPKLSKKEFIDSLLATKTNLRRLTIPQLRNDQNDDHLRLSKLGLVELDMPFVSSTDKFINVDDFPELGTLRLRGGYLQNAEMFPIILKYGSQFKKLSLDPEGWTSEYIKRSNALKSTNMVNFGLLEFDVPRKAKNGRLERFCTSIDVKRKTHQKLFDAFIRESLELRSIFCYNFCFLESLGRLFETSNNLQRISIFKLSHMDEIFLMEPTQKPIFNQMKNLERLELGSTHLSDSFFTSINAPGLIHLMLRDCRHLTDNAIDQLTKNSPNIRHIDLSFNPQLTDKSIICAVNNLKHLMTLDLSGCTQMSNKALIFISLCCRNLRQLKITGCDKINDENGVLWKNLFEKMKNLRFVTFGKIALRHNFVGM